MGAIAPGHHLLLRVQALAVRTATTPARVKKAIPTGDRLLTPSGCQPCSMALRIAPPLR